jgi:hypothetical protein
MPSYAYSWPKTANEAEPDNTARRHPGQSDPSIFPSYFLQAIEKKIQFKYCTIKRQVSITYSLHFIAMWVHLQKYTGIIRNSYKLWFAKRKINQHQGHFWASIFEIRSWTCLGAPWGVWQKLGCSWLIVSNGGYYVTGRQAAKSRASLPPPPHKEKSAWLQAAFYWRHRKKEEQGGFF